MLSPQSCLGYKFCFCVGFQFNTFLRIKHYVFGGIFFFFDMEIIAYFAMFFKSLFPTVLFFRLVNRAGILYIKYGIG